MTEPIHVTSFRLDESSFTYSEDGPGWYADRLVTYVKEHKLEPFDLPLKHIDISIMPYTINTVLGFVEHIKRVQNTNLDHPVIMDSNGQTIDGWHRIAKALVEGVPTVKAVRFDDMPPYDFTK